MFAGNTSCFQRTKIWKSETTQSKWSKQDHEMSPLVLILAYILCKILHLKYMWHPRMEKCDCRRHWRRSPSIKVDHVWTAEAERAFKWCQAKTWHQLNHKRTHLPTIPWCCRGSFVILSLNCLVGQQLPASARDCVLRLLKSSQLTSIRTKGQSAGRKGTTFLPLMSQWL